MCGLAVDSDRADRNFLMDVRPIKENANNLARYLSRYGTETCIVVIVGAFGRFFELWCNEMGLGPICDHFMTVNGLNL